MNFQVKQEIADYFEELGAVESIRIVEKCAFVQFKRSHVARIVLAKSFYHKINRCKCITIEAADQLHQPDHPLNSPPEQNSDSNILHALNNDCLLEVFKYLNKIDLMNVAQTCIHFNQQAQHTFRSKFKHLKLHHVNQEMIGRLLNTFGSVIQSLDIRNVDITTMQIIDRECTQLKALTLDHCKCNWRDFRVLLTRLEILQLNVCEISNFSNDLCLNLKHLELNRCSGVPNRRFFGLLPIGRTKLKQFHHDFLNNWIAMCPMLEKLTIYDLSGKLDSKILRSIGEHLKCLQSLKFDARIVEREHFQNDMQCIANISSLTNLKLSFNNLPIGRLVRALVANNIPIERFEIMRGDIDKDGIESLMELKRLEVLSFDSCINKLDDHLILLAKEMPKLRELHLDGILNKLSIGSLKQVVKYANQLLLLTLAYYHDIQIGIDDYMTILEDVKKRPEKKRLVIKIPKYDFRSVPEDMLNKNRETFYIKKL